MKLTRFEGRSAIILSNISNRSFSGKESSLPRAFQPGQDRGGQYDHINPGHLTRHDQNHAWPGGREGARMTTGRGSEEALSIGFSSCFARMVPSGHAGAIETTCCSHYSYDVSGWVGLFKKTHNIVPAFKSGTKASGRFHMMGPASFKNNLMDFSTIFNDNRL